MKQAAAELEYERAARLRDDLGALNRALEKNAVVLADGTDADVFALAEDELEAAVQVFHVRDGRIRGQRGWVVEKVEDVGPEDLVEHLLQQVYGESPEAVPREVLVPALPARRRRRSRPGSRDCAASRVDLRVPQRGDKRALLETVERNAGQALNLHKTRRAGDLTTRSQALKEIQEALDLPEAPLRIECYDVSNLQGTEVVASMVVFEDGLPRKSEYRRFAVRGTEGQDDTASMHEVITRRFRRYLDERAEASDVEIGAGHRPRDRPAAASSPTRRTSSSSTAARRRWRRRPARSRDLGIDDVALVGLAKRLEEVWLPGDEYPVILPRSSEGLYLLQRVRDEAHRFAITYHRQRRSRAMTTSVLDGVPGLGPARRTALLKHFGSVKKLRAADVGRGRRGAGHRAGHRPGGRRVARRHRPARRRP